LEDRLSSKIFSTGISVGDVRNWRMISNYCGCGSRMTAKRSFWKQSGMIGTRKRTGRGPGRCFDFSRNSLNVKARDTCCGFPRNSPSVKAHDTCCGSRRNSPNMKGRDMYATIPWSGWVTRCNRNCGWSSGWRY
jgi:hypothetical protein